MTSAPRKNRIKATEPSFIPEGYIWCNDITHVGTNPWLGKKEDYFAPNRAQCRLCFNRQQKGRNKPSEIEPVETITTPNIKKMVLENSPLSAYTNVSNPPVIQNSFKLDLDNSSPEVNMNNSSQQNPTTLLGRISQLEKEVLELKMAIKNQNDLTSEMLKIKEEIKNIKGMIM